MSVEKQKFRLEGRRMIKRGSLLWGGRSGPLAMERGLGRGNITRRVVQDQAGDRRKLKSMGYRGGICNEARISPKVEGP